MKKDIRNKHLAKYLDIPITTFPMKDYVVVVKGTIIYNDKEFELNTIGKLKFIGHSESSAILEKIPKELLEEQLKFCDKKTEIEVGQIPNEIIKLV